MTDDQLLIVGLACLPLAAGMVIISTVRGAQEFCRWRAEIRERESKARMELAAEQALAVADELTVRSFESVLTGEIATIEVAPVGKRGRTKRSKVLAAVAGLAPDTPEEIEALPEVPEIQGEDGAVL